MQICWGMPGSWKVTSKFSDWFYCFDKANHQIQGWTFSWGLLMSSIIFIASILSNFPFGSLGRILFVTKMPKSYLSSKLWRKNSSITSLVALKIQAYISQVSFLTLCWLASIFDRILIQLAVAGQSPLFVEFLQFQVENSSWFEPYSNVLTLMNDRYYFVGADLGCIE